MDVVNGLNMWQPETYNVEDWQSQDNSCQFKLDVTNYPEHLYQTLTNKSSRRPCLHSGIKIARYTHVAAASTQPIHLMYHL